MIEYDVAENLVSERIPQVVGAFERLALVIDEIDRLTGALMTRLGVVTLSYPMPGDDSSAEIDEPLAPFAGRIVGLRRQAEEIRASLERQLNTLEV